MNPSRAAVGMCFDRTFPPAAVLDFARRLDAGGADQLWIIEDCFYTAGPSLAAAALAVTDRLTLGLGILPAVARTAAVTAMEIATLSELSGGRVLPGIGHGIQSWMRQMGVQPASPLTALEEVITTVSRLLNGERVSFEGRTVHLEDVELDRPPSLVPPVLAGVRGPKSLALAGRVAGGVVLAEPASPSFVRFALEQAAPTRPDFHIAVFSVLCVQADRRAAHRRMAPWLAKLIEDDTPEVRQLPFYGELVSWYRDRGQDGLIEIPTQWWQELGPIGTLEDALDHVAALEQAGVHSIGLFPPPDLGFAREQLGAVLQLASR
ncbi:MAG: 5,10-methylenetetrahydromethanopterin reductase [Pseudonocardiales bacterium]|jgi:5,10-methylenetetrahydromethanopterin reductase|nr:5,10-methylenetetrahydromethanopterin reductase [Pseudonocardiales bacterium]